MQIITSKESGCSSQSTLTMTTSIASQIPKSAINGEAKIICTSTTGHARHCAYTLKKLPKRSIRVAVLKKTETCYILIHNMFLNILFASSTSFFGFVGGWLLSCSHESTTTVKSERGDWPSQLLLYLSLLHNQSCIQKHTIME